MKIPLFCVAAMLGLLTLAAGGVLADPRIQLVGSVVVFSATALLLLG